MIQKNLLALIFIIKLPNVIGNCSWFNQFSIANYSITHLCSIAHNQNTTSTIAIMVVATVEVRRLITSATSTTITFTASRHHSQHMTRISILIRPSQCRLHKLTSKSLSNLLAKRRFKCRQCIHRVRTVIQTWLCLVHRKYLHITTRTMVRLRRTVKIMTTMMTATMERTMTKTWRVRCAVADACASAISSRYATTSFRRFLILLIISIKSGERLWHRIVLCSSSSSKWWPVQMAVLIKARWIWVRTWVSQIILRRLRLFGV